MQVTRVWSLVQENPIHHKAKMPGCHNYWVCALEPMSCNYWAYVPKLLKPAGPKACALQQEKSLQWEAQAPQLESSPCSLQLDKSLSSNVDPAQPKIKINTLTNKQTTQWQIKYCLPGLKSSNDFLLHLNKMPRGLPVRLWWLFQPHCVPSSCSLGLKHSFLQPIYGLLLFVTQVSAQCHFLREIFPDHPNLRNFYHSTEFILYSMAPSDILFVCCFSLPNNCKLHSCPGPRTVTNT